MAPQAALRLGKQLADDADSLARLPYRFPKFRRRANVRKLVTGQYLILYRIVQTAKVVAPRPQPPAGPGLKPPPSDDKRIGLLVIGGGHNQRWDFSFHVSSGHGAYSKATISLRPSLTWRTQTTDQPRIVTVSPLRPENGRSARGGEQKRGLHAAGVLSQS